MDYGLSGKVAIVTGAAQGIGATIAQVLAEEGCSVVVADLNVTQAEKTAALLQKTGEAIALGVDVAKKAEVEALVEKTLARWGRVDILVNNAGVCHSTPFALLEAADWEKAISINLTGTFYCCQAVAEVMKRQRSGRIINISSLAGKSGGISVAANYSASKAGILGLTKSLARELAPYGITVNAVTPGTIDTELIRVFSPEQREKLVKSIPLGRFGTTHDVAYAVAFLASDKASFITGEVMDVNGGQFID